MDASVGAAAADGVEEGTLDAREETAAEGVREEEEGAEVEADEKEEAEWESVKEGREEGL